MDAGTAAILGAVVGGVIPGGIAVGSELWDQHRRRYALARLAHGQFASSEAVIATALVDRQWWPTELDVRFSLSYDDRKLLAEALKPAAWNAVDLAARILDLIYIEQQPKGLKPLDDKAKVSVRNALIVTREATFALEKTVKRITPLNREAYESQLLKTP